MTCERGHNGYGYAENGACLECERQRRAERVPDRRVPPMPPWTTLEALQREHNRLRELAAKGIAEPRRMPEAWAKHLAEVLRADPS